MAMLNDIFINLYIPDVKVLSFVDTLIRFYIYQYGHKGMDPYCCLVVGENHDPSS